MGKMIRCIVAAATLVVIVCSCNQDRPYISQIETGVDSSAEPYQVTAFFEVVGVQLGMSHAHIASILGDPAATPRPRMDRPQSRVTEASYKGVPGTVSSFNVTFIDLQAVSVQAHYAPELVSHFGGKGALVKRMETKLNAPAKEVEVNGQQSYAWEHLHPQNLVVALVASKDGAINLLYWNEELVTQLA